MRQQRNPLALTGAVVLILAGVIGGLVALGANHLPGQILAILAIADGILLYRESAYLRIGLRRP